MRLLIKTFSFACGATLLYWLARSVLRSPWEALMLVAAVMLMSIPNYPSPPR
jgi:hypothetical protein